MFKLAVVTLLVAAATCVSGQYRRPYVPAHGGYDYPNVPIPYDFGYDIAGDYGEFRQNRKEVGDGNGNVQGSYGYTDAYGIYRQVDYVADAYGFRANVRTNEPGTDNQNPADVQIQASPAHGGYAAPGPRHGGYHG